MKKLKTALVACALTLGMASSVQAMGWWVVCYGWDEHCASVTEWYEDGTIIEYEIYLGEFVGGGIFI
jgi:hypothetical protein